MDKFLKEKFKKIKFLVLDFDGVITDNRVLVSEDGKESVFCNRSDGLGIALLRKKGVETMVISREKNKTVEARCRKLKIKFFRGIENKCQKFLEETRKRKLKLEEVCFVGNDINDLECLEKAGIGAAVADSYKLVLEAADYITKKRGGEGAVREIADLVLEAE